MKNEQTLKDLISLMLAINPDPSDEQFHALAFSVGVDHETLEAISYRMLAEDQDTDVSVQTDQAGADQFHANLKARIKAGEEGESQEQKVLEDKVDPEQTSPDDLLLNDGAPAADNHDESIQQDLYTDGAGPDDTGVGIESDKGAMYDDGEPPLMLAALKRLKGE